MAQLNDKSIHIRDGQATLYKRERSNLWQVRYKVKGYGWRRTSLKTADLNEAKEKAYELVDEVSFLQRKGFSLATVTFSSVAKSVLIEMEENIREGNNEHYTYAIKKYLLPYFKNKHINHITTKDLILFDKYRTKQLGHIASSSLINTHNVALKKCFDHAINDNKMRISDMPKLQKAKNKDFNKRGSFTNDEYLRLNKFLRTDYLKQARNGNEKDKRNMLRDYVQILANSGIRNGTESANIKWKNIEWIIDKDSNEKDVDIFIETSKTEKGRRHVYARTRSIESALKRIISRDAEFTNLTLDEVIKMKADKYVFRKAEDKQFISNMGRMFARVLEELDMKFDKQTNRERTLYSLRHYYISMELSKGEISHYLLADNVGTSVAMFEKYYADQIRRQNIKKFSGRKS